MSYTLLKKIVRNIFLLTICLSFVKSYAQVTLSTEYFRIHINAKGFITSMKNISKTPNKEFSPADKPSPLLCLYNSDQKKYYEPQKASYAKGTGILSLSYANGSVAQVKIETKKREQLKGEKNEEVTVSIDIIVIGGLDRLLEI